MSDRVNIDYLELGGTLFIPASHKSLHSIVNEDKYPELRSVVIDFEDGLDEKNFLSGEENFKTILHNRHKTKGLYVFVRVKDWEHLLQVLAFENISKIDGFVLPKFSLANAKNYIYPLLDTPFVFMPSIEGLELFNPVKLHELKEILLPYKEKILLVRYGLEDMLKLLTLSRPQDKSVFDLSAVSVTLGNFIATFKSVGFAVSGGVYPNFGDDTNFKKDIDRDLQEGLFSKTIIHPCQIGVVNEAYKVTQDALSEALSILNAQVLTSLNSKMIEPQTMSPYALEIVSRANIYGIHRES